MTTGKGGNTMENYALLTDATADLTRQLAQELDVEVIPMPLDIDGEPYDFSYFNDTFTVRFFYDALRAGKFAHTSQINEQTYFEYFEKHLRAGRDVLYLCFTSGLSGTIHVARRCMEQLRQKYPQRRMVCVDTLCASVGQCLLVHSAARRRLAGASMQELAGWAEQNKQRVCHCFKVDDLDHLRRGGRISATTAMVGSALQIKPILVVDDEGKLQTIAKCRGKKRAQEFQLSCMEKFAIPEDNATVVIGHGDTEPEAAELADRVRERFPYVKDVVTVPIGPIIGAHVGPGMLALIFYGASKTCK